MATTVDHLQADCAVRVRRAFADRDERAMDCWYGWGSLAMSGGDGAARRSPGSKPR